MQLFAGAHTIIQWITLLVPNYWVRLISYTLMGFCQVKASCSYTWLYELVPPRNKSHVSSFINSYDYGTVLVVCVYILHVNRNWLWLFLFMTSLGTVSYGVMMLFLPESPRWLLI